MAENAPAAVIHGMLPAFTADDLAPGRARPRKGTSVNLGFTAAFQTPEGKVAEAAVAELSSVRNRGSTAPVIALSPEMIDAPRPPPRRLEVCCALEVLSPGILQQITAIWNNAECAARLQRLIGEDYGGCMAPDPLVRRIAVALRHQRKPRRLKRRAPRARRRGPGSLRDLAPAAPPSRIPDCATPVDSATPVDCATPVDSAIPVDCAIPVDSANA
ncbi:MAG: hypothetical protein JWN73_2289 [Betaproteobacteria bacterium]|nr:hypothetical protein [Betaproteobacteria bacterium]